MSRYIDREDLLNNLKQFAPEHLTPLIVMLIEKHPTADVAEVRHGKWNKNGNGRDCSICGFKYYANGSLFNYCPNCGARMDGETNDQQRTAD